MTTLAQIGRQALAVQPVDTLILTPTLAKWSMEHDELQFKPEHVARVAELLMGKHKVSRTGRFGPSGRGSCPRQQVFSFLGVDKLHVSSGLKHVFWDGHNAHMIMQLILLDSGLADDIEVDVNVPTYRSVGSMDAVGTHPEGWRYGVDIKTTSALATQVRDTQQVVEDWMRSASWEMPEHWFARHMLKAYLQVICYKHLANMMGMSILKFVLLYQVKTSDGSPPLREVVVEDFDKATEFVLAELETLNKAVDERRLPPMLADCMIQTGKAYEDCAYRAVCAGIDDDNAPWPQEQPVSMPGGRAVQIRI